MRLLLFIATILLATSNSLTCCLAFAPLRIQGTTTTRQQQEGHLVAKPSEGKAAYHHHHYPYSVKVALSSTPETEADIKRVHQDADAIFSVIDIDGNGEISLDELSQHLSKAGYADNIVEKIFAKFDLNKDGGVSREEFRAGLVQFSPLRSAPGLGSYNAEFVKEIHADADSLFQTVDTDRSGTISKDELGEHLERASKYTSAAIANIFAALALDDSGESSSVEITKEELRDAFVRSSALRQAIGEGPNYK